jgi:hypothetical protein
VSSAAVVAVPALKTFPHSPGAKSRATATSDSERPLLRWRRSPRFDRATPLGTPVDPRNDVRAFKAVLARAGLRDVRLHDLRHTAASLLLAQGMHAGLVMEVLGHSHNLTINTYSHVMRRCSGRRLDGGCVAGVRFRRSGVEPTLGFEPRTARLQDRSGAVVEVSAIPKTPVPQEDPSHRIPLVTVVCHSRGYSRGYSAELGRTRGLVMPTSSSRRLP